MNQSLLLIIGIKNRTNVARLYVLFGQAMDILGEVSILPGIILIVRYSEYCICIVVEMLHTRIQVRRTMLALSGYMLVLLLSASILISRLCSYHNIVDVDLSIS